MTSSESKKMGKTIRMFRAEDCSWPEISEYLGVSITECRRMYFAKPNVRATRMYAQAVAA